jgi:hypothetical protein
VALLAGLAFPLAPLFLPGLFHWLFDLAPAWIAALGLPLVSLGVLAAPALVGVPLGLVISRMVAETARRDPDRATAMAAGAGMGAALAGFASLLAHSGSFPSGLDLGVPAIALALGVGSLGAMAFQGLPSDPVTGRRTPVPSALAALLAAGVNGPALLATGLALASLVDWFGNPTLLLVGLLGYPLGSYLAGVLATALLAPVTALTSSALARRIPGTSPYALATGAMAVTVLPVLAAAQGLHWHYELVRAVPHLVCAGVMVVLTAHGLAAYLGTSATGRGRAPRPSLPG